MTSKTSSDIYLQLNSPQDKERTMLSSRRHRSCGQSIFVMLVMLTLMYGGYLYFDLKKNFEETSERALRYQQQQESLTGQLQVVYEHRLRLEKTLQEAKGEAKRTKEDSQRKLEIQQQEASNRYNALNIEHKMLKSRHDDLREELDQTKVQQRKAEEEKEHLEDQMRKNITTIMGAADVKRQSLLAQIDYLTVQSEKGQQCDSNLQQITQQLDQVIQEKSLQVTRRMELEQLLSSCDKGTAFLQTTVDNLNTQVRTLEMQLQQFNIQKAVPPNGPRLVVNNQGVNVPLQNNILPGAPKELDPYKDQKLAFDRQRQQDLVEQQYIKRINIPAVEQPQNEQQQAILRPGIQQQLVVQQQQPIAFNQDQQQQQQQQLVPQNKDPNEVKPNLQLHLDTAEKETAEEKKEESDYDQEDSESDVQGQGVILKDPVKAAQEKPVVQEEDQQAGNEEEDRLPDAVQERKNEEVEEQENEDDNEPESAGENPQEDDEEDQLQARQEHQLEDDLKREQEAQIGLHPPVDESQDKNEDAPGGLRLNVQRDEVEQNIEEQVEGFRKKQQNQLLERAQAAKEGAGDEVSDYDNNGQNSESDKDQPDGVLQRKFGVDPRGGNEAEQDLGQDNGDDRALDRPEINDDPMNEAANDAPVLEHPKETSQEKNNGHEELNQEMR